MQDPTDKDELARGKRRSHNESWRGVQRPRHVGGAFSPSSQFKVNLTAEAPSPAADPPLTLCRGADL
jgi:hypothetical protein